MGNKQSYDLAQAQARLNDNHLPNEVETQQDEDCRPVHLVPMPSTRKIKIPKERRDKENVSVGSSSRADSSTPVVEEHNENSRESPIDVPDDQRRASGTSEASIHRETSIWAKPSVANTNHMHHYTHSYEPQQVLLRAEELPKCDLNEEAVEEAQVEQYDSEKARAKHVAEEAVRQIEAKRNSKDHSVIEQNPPSPQPHDTEKLRKVVEVENVPLEQGGSGYRYHEEYAIEEATRQLDDAIRDDHTHQEESAVILEESVISDFATVSLALDEDISAIETPHKITEIHKLHYTHTIEKHPLDAEPSQTHYIKLK